MAYVPVPCPLCKKEEVIKYGKKLCERKFPHSKHLVGNRNTQAIAIKRKHLTLRSKIKRLARKTICFSKLAKMHNIVIGLFINKFEFGLAI